MRYIVHIADIHIGSSIDRYNEYHEVFDTLISKIKSHICYKQCIVVIAGDIFHYKNKLAAEDINAFDYLIKTLDPLPVIIIPGNHDANVHNNNRMDLITPLKTRHKNIYYLRDTGVYNLFGLNFVHASIFDVDGGAHPVKMDTLLKGVKDPILLFHGMVNDAKFGSFTATGKIITTEIMDKVHIGILGDIHESQFIRPHVAYSGSLIQQNIGEGMTKGIIIWDVLNRRGEFLKIPNNYGYIKLDVRTFARGEKTPSPNGGDVEDIFNIEESIEIPKNILSLNLIADGNVPADRIAEIEKKFGIRANKIQYKNTQRTSPVISHELILREMLKADGASDSEIQKIINIHQGYHTEFQNKCRWNLINMAWNNLFKYGTGNYIDFRKIGGIGGIIASNCAGKSSVLDIIVFGLFNHTVRGNKSDIIRKGTTNASLRIEFEANDIVYAVERYEYSSSTSDIKLYIKDITLPENPIWKKMDNGTTIIHTYAKIAEIIGGKDEFLATSMMTQDNDRDIIKMSNLQRKTVLSDIFGFRINKNMKAEITANCRDAELRKMGFRRPDKSVEQYEAEINALNATISKSAHDLTQLEQNEQFLFKEIVSRGKPPRDVNVINEEINSINITISQLQNNIKQIDIKIGNYHKVDGDEIPPSRSTDRIMKEINDMDVKYDIGQLRSRKIILDSELSTISQAISISYNDNIYKQLNKELSEAISRIAKSKLQLNQYPHKNNNIDINILLKQKDEINSQISAEVSKLKSSKREMIDMLMKGHLKVEMPVDSPPPVQSVDFYFNEINVKESQIKTIRETFRGVNTPLINKLEASRSELLKQSSLKFNDGCKECQYNKQTCNAELAEIDSRIAKMRIIEKDAINYNNECNAKILSIEGQLTGLRANHKNAVKKLEYDRQMEKYSNYIIKEETIKSLLEEEKNIASHNLFRNTAISELQIQLTKLTNEISASINYSSLIERIMLDDIQIQKITEKLSQMKNAKDYEDKLQERNEIIGKIERWQKTRELVKEYDNTLRHEYYLLLNKKITYESDIIKRNAAKELLIEELRISKDSDFASLQIAYTENSQKKNILSRDVIIMQGDIDNLTKLSADAKIYEEKYPEIESEYRVHSLYKKCITGGFKIRVIDNNLKYIIENMNNILEHFSSFKVSYNIDPLSNNKIDIILQDNGFVLPIELASGFQKFIISLIFRLVLTANINSAAKFIFIDEGFGCMDKENLSKMNELFITIKNIYSFIAIVSHVSELQTLIEFPLYIQSGQTASIQYGEPMTLSMGLTTAIKTKTKRNKCTNSSCDKTTTSGKLCSVCNKKTINSQCTRQTLPPN